MTCFNPKYAKYSYGKSKTRDVGKNITFIKKDQYEGYKRVLDSMDPLSRMQHGLMMIPCKKCLGCRLDHASMYGLRGLLEAKQWKNNCFITLTYNNEHLPKDKCLHKEDIQDFLKRMRKQYQGYESRIWYDKRTHTSKVEYPIRYFYSGEYGPEKLRPHFHIGIFNWKPKDLKFFKYNEYGDPIYTSEKVQKLWSIYDPINRKHHNIGFITVEDMNYNTAQYIGRYTAKKALGLDDEKIKSKGLTKEFIELSRRGGLGYQYIENKEQFEKMKRNYGIYIQDKKGNIKLKKIPQYFKNKWKDIDYMEYLTINDERTREQNENIEKLLAQTTLTKDEYIKKQKLILLDKLKHAKTLKRNRIKKTTA